MLYLLIGFILALLVLAVLAGWIIWRLEEGRKLLLQALISRSAAEYTLLRKAEQGPAASPSPSGFARPPYMDDELEALIDSKRRAAQVERLESALQDEAW